MLSKGAPKQAGVARNRITSSQGGRWLFRFLPVGCMSDPKPAKAVIAKGFFVGTLQNHPPSWGKPSVAETTGDLRYPRNSYLFLWALLESWLLSRHLTVYAEDFGSAWSLDRGVDGQLCACYCSGNGRLLMSLPSPPRFSAEEAKAPPPSAWTEGQEPNLWPCLPFPPCPRPFFL